MLEVCHPQILVKEEKISETVISKPRLEEKPGRKRQPLRLMSDLRQTSPQHRRPDLRSLLFRHGKSCQNRPSCMSRPMSYNCGSLSNKFQDQGRDNISTQRQPQTADRLLTLDRKELATLASLFTLRGHVESFRGLLR